mmetsp:Transcript_43533/g.79603  ORF Transcript_43533/g.79603 Transcript_43533/m.79603 type:complete len:154 (-) Transcript_43533:1193-1654(-)
MATHKIYNKVNKTRDFFCVLSKNDLAGLMDTCMVEEASQQLPLNLRVVYRNAPYPLRKMEIIKPLRWDIMNFNRGPERKYRPFFFETNFHCSTKNGCTFKNNPSSITRRMRSFAQIRVFVKASTMRKNKFTCTATHCNQLFMTRPRQIDDFNL